MADNYVLFSVELPLATEEQRAWWRERFRLLRAVDPNDLPADKLDPEVDYDDQEVMGPPCDWTIADSGNLWLSSEDQADLEVLATMVSAYQERFGVLAPFELEWAETCSRPIPGEFGGGALLLYRGFQWWKSTGAALAELRELAGVAGEQQ